MTEIVFYFLLFLALYIQVFYLVTFLEKRREIRPTLRTTKYPTLSIVVPCFNEEKTVAKTINSLLATDYPKDKLEILVIDDGSKDNTWQVLQSLLLHFKTKAPFLSYQPPIKIFHKENGGKSSALNLGLTVASGEIFGCVDADSFVAPDAIAKMIKHFEDEEVMAVGSSVIVEKPKNMIELAQAAEYHMAVYVKKVLGWLAGLHVVAGALSLFRKEVFAEIGNYRDAHRTEDMEIIFRMQVRGMKIAQCHDAFVYTVAPDTVAKLYYQRRRWIYGFINNVLDYRHTFMRPKFGNFAMLTIPSGFIGIGGVIYLFGDQVANIITLAGKKITEFLAVGFSVNFNPNFDPFFITTKAPLILLLLSMGLLVATMLIGKWMAGVKPSFFDIACFVLIYSIIAPFWMVSAIGNTVFRRQINWR